MVSEDNTVVLLFDSDDTSADLISRSFASVDVSHQLRRVTNSGAMFSYLKDAMTKDGMEKDLRPRLIVIHAKKFDSDVEAAIASIKHDTELKRVPVIVFSESSDEQSVQKAYQLKTNSYIVCPETPAQVESVITEVASYWLKWNQLP